MTDPIPNVEAAPVPMRRLVLVAPDDRLFAERYRALCGIGAEAGLSVFVVTRAGPHQPAIEETGARVLALGEEGSGLNPMTAGYAAGQLAATLKGLKADILHAIGPRGILVGGTAAAMAGVGARIYTPAGFGALGRRDGAAGRLARAGFGRLMRGPLATGRTRFLLEDPEEARTLGLDPLDTGVTLLAGGVAGAESAAAIGRLYAALLSP
ncbi:hypothetical protein J2X36_000374 [Methylobacterium sp. BE186]|uniref:hypothetical protein n=1 Tax=Methylobacterium sp. BE186 TaxID=2817715 RepID=UPI00285DE682|nr:hypothetical protein [Methylobacterium sp. BE186]MDR7035639.1 hypothetical protein [Methylobacterium sp. BE186]